MKIKELLEGYRPGTYYHMSPSKNKASISSSGLQPRLTMYKNIHRKPGIFMFAAHEQASNWAFWSADCFRKSFDVWRIELPAGYALEHDPHPDMDIYNAVIGYESIPPDCLTLLNTIRPPKFGYDWTPPTPPKIENFSLSEGGGYIPKNAEEAADPRWMMAITGDIKPGETGRQAGKMGFKLDSDGLPPVLRADGNIHNT